MLELLTYGFMQRAFVAGAVIGVVCAIIGVYVVLRGMAFIGTGIAHAAFGGVALGLFLGINPMLSAVVFCTLVGWGIGGVARSGAVREDTAVGIFFAATMALGILLIGLSQGYTMDLFSYLFGSILAVTPTDMCVTLALGVMVLGVVLFFYKELLFITFDPEMAEVSGVPATRLYFLLITLIATTVVLSIKVVGIVLVSALLVIPAAAAWQLAHRFSLMMLLAVLFGVTATTGGLVLSYVLNTASGATIVLLATGLFFVATLAAAWRERRLPVFRRPT